MTAANTNVALDKMLAGLKPQFDALSDRIAKQNAVDLGNIILTQNDLATRMAAIETLLGAIQKDVAKLGSKGASRSKTTATHSEASTASDPAQTNVNPLSIADVISSVPISKFPNRLNWFKEQYTTSEVFRNDYTTQDIANAMEKDPTITARKKNNPDGSKCKAELGLRAQFCWNIIKKDKSMERFEVAYQDAKKKAEDAAPQAIIQHESVESNTPPH